MDNHTQYDVVIIGGGPAGLATAHYLDRHDVSVLLLEEMPHLGGRALTRDVAGEPVNMGAMFVYGGTAAEELARNLGVSLERFVPTSFGIHYKNKTIVTTDNEALVDHLSLTSESKKALHKFVQNATNNYFQNTRNGDLRPRNTHLGNVSAQTQLEGLPNEVQEILEAAIRGGSVARPSELTATYALRYFASYLVHEKNNRFVATAGMGALPQALFDSLKHTEVRTHHSVKTVHRDGDQWRINGNASHGEHRSEASTEFSISAQHVVMAVPAPRIGEMVDLSQWKSEALDSVKTPGSTELGVVVDTSRLDRSTMPDANVPGNVSYDDWSFVVTPGRPFDAIINPRPGRNDGIAQFVCYGNSSGYLPEANQPNSKVLDQWIEEFLKVAPGLRDRILGAEIRSWRHCFSLLTPERNAALEAIQAPVMDSMHFAGDYSSETAGTHGAYAEAKRVATDIFEKMAAQTSSAV